ncbi:hypothetical protein HDU96_002838, partial [Phlyctochytrium bullatum]
MHLPTLLSLALTLTAATALPAPASLHPRQAAPSFASIDISRLGGDGAAAEANAARICPSNLSPAELEAIRRVAEDAEKTIFNPAIAAAGSAA